MKPSIPWTRKRWLLRALLTLLGVALLARIFANLDVRAGAHVLARLGPAVVVLALPLAAGLAIDAVAWRSLARGVGANASFGSMFAARCAFEAVVLTAPGGSVAATASAPVILQRLAGIEPAHGLAVATARKWLVMRAHAVYLALATFAAWRELVALSNRLFGTATLPWLLLASTILPLGSAALLQLGLGRGRVVSRVRSWVGRVPIEAVRAFAQRGAALSRADDGLSVLAKLSRPKETFLLLLMLSAWACEALDTYVTLRLLGVDVSVATALGAEAAMSMLRSLAFFSPGGLGVVDVGYLGFARALGAHDADGVAVALLVLRRTKEVLIASLGYGLLALVARGASRGRTPATALTA